MGDAGADGAPSHLVHTRQRVRRSRGSAAASNLPGRVESGSQAAGPGGACGAAGAEGGGAGAHAGRPHCRPTSVQTVLFARDGFSFKSCVPPPPAPLCRLLAPEPSGTNFQLRRNGDTR